MAPLGDSRVMPHSSRPGRLGGLGLFVCTMMMEMMLSMMVGRISRKMMNSGITAMQVFGLENKYDAM